MTNKRIKQLADFFYSSDNSNDVPIRLFAETGQYTGFGFNKEALRELLTILKKSNNLKQDLLNFREKYEG